MRIHPHARLHTPTDKLCCDSSRSSNEGHGSLSRLQLQATQRVMNIRKAHAGPDLVCLQLQAQCA